MAAIDDECKTSKKKTELQKGRGYRCLFELSYEVSLLVKRERGRGWGRFAMKKRGVRASASVKRKGLFTVSLLDAVDRCPVVLLCYSAGLRVWRIAHAIV